VFEGLHLGQPEKRNSKEISNGMGQAETKVQNFLYVVEIKPDKGPKSFISSDYKTSLMERMSNLRTFREFREKIHKTCYSEHVFKM
jgi:hypothetical protein